MRAGHCRCLHRDLCFFFLFCWCFYLIVCALYDYLASTEYFYIYEYLLHICTFLFAYVAFAAEKLNSNKRKAQDA